MIKPEKLNLKDQVLFTAIIIALFSGFLIPLVSLPMTIVDTFFILTLIIFTYDSVELRELVVPLSIRVIPSLIAFMLNILYIRSAEYVFILFWIMGMQLFVSWAIYLVAILMFLIRVFRK